MKTLNQYILESFITENKNSIEHLKLPKTDYEFNWDDQYCYPFFYNVTDNVFAIGANAQELGDFHDDLFNNPDKEYVKFEDDWAKLCNVYAYNKSKDELPEDSICGRIWDLNNYAEVIMMHSVKMETSQKKIMLILLLLHSMVNKIMKNNLQKMFLKIIAI